MANGAKVALAVGAGYLLGRTRKMRIALMLAGAGLTGKFPPRPGELVSHGLQSLGASDQLHDLTDQLRGEVLTAAKAAAMAAATHRVDALADRMQGVVPTEDVGRATGSATRGLTSATGLVGSAGRDDITDEDTYDDEPLDVEEEDLNRDDFEEDDENVEDLGRDTGFDDEDYDVEDEEPYDEPPAPRRPARRAASPRASTRRAKRAPADSDSETPRRPVRRGRASAATKRAPVRRGR